MTEGAARDGGRPGVWIGHVSCRSHDVARSAAFYVRLGVRPVRVTEQVAVLELAGGTHLVVVGVDLSSPVEPVAELDVMVADLDRARTEWLDLSPSEIVEGPVHRTFTLVDPSGVRVNVHDSHVVGVV